MNRLFEDGDRAVDAVILAMAGMIRLGYPKERTDVNFLPLNPKSGFQRGPGRAGNRMQRDGPKDADSYRLSMTAPPRLYPSRARVPG